MPHQVTSITGTVGALRCGHQPAAALSAWTLTKLDDARWTLTATVANPTFWLSQRPLWFVTPNAWRWPVLAVEITGASCTATLGPKESRYGLASTTA